MLPRPLYPGDVRRALPMVLGVLVLACACGARSTDDAGRTHAIEAEVWSPYCPGRLLIDCTTRQARDLRDEIAERVRRGESREAILDWVRDEYGEGALARPAASGLSLVIWLVPALLFVIGGVVVTLVIRRWRAVPAET